jgi:hypothetical protein
LINGIAKKRGGNNGKAMFEDTRYANICFWPVLGFRAARGGSQTAQEQFVRLVNMRTKWTNGHTH